MHLCSRKADAVENAVKTLKNKNLDVYGHVCDMADKQARLNMLKKISDQHKGRLDILVSNVAHSGFYGNQLEAKEKHFDKVYDINVKSQFFLIKECYSMLLESKDNGGAANILLISSMTARTPSFLLGLYASAKASVENMVAFLKDELMGDGIRINGIAPGLIKTTMSSPIWKSDQG